LTFDQDMNVNMN